MPGKEGVKVIISETLLLSTILFLRRAGERTHRVASRLLVQKLEEAPAGIISCAREQTGAPLQVKGQRSPLGVGSYGRVRTAPCGLRNVLDVMFVSTRTSQQGPTTWQAKVAVPARKVYD